MAVNIKILVCVILLIFCDLNLFQLVIAEDKSNLNNSYEHKFIDKNTRNIGEEKYSHIVEVDSFVYIGEDIKLKDARKIAYTQAKAKAIEKFHSHIKSRTIIKNGVLYSAFIDSLSEGSVNILEDKDIGLTKDGRYHVWIKAEVKHNIEKYFSHKDSKDNKKFLKVSIWTEKQNYVKGEEIKVFIKGNIDFYAMVVNISPSGDIIPLYPNKYSHIISFKGNNVYYIPNNNEKYKLIVDFPFGRECIKVYASTNPLGDVNLKFKSIKDFFYSYNGNIKDFSKKLRAIKVVPLEGAEFIETSVFINTHQ